MPKANPKGEIPILMKSASGNQTDSSCFGEIAVDYQKQLQFDSLIVADCSIFTQSNIQLMSNIRWLSRVPLTVKQATIVQTLSESEFSKSKIEGYSFVEKDVLALE
jgi:transposase